MQLPNLSALFVVLPWLPAIWATSMPEATPLTNAQRIQAGLAPARPAQDVLRRGLNRKSVNLGGQCAVSFGL